MTNLSAKMKKSIVQKQNDRNPPCSRPPMFIFNGLDASDGYIAAYVIVFWYQ